MCVDAKAVVVLLACTVSLAGGLTLARRQSAAQSPRTLQQRSPPPPHAPLRRLWLRAVGDVMLARGVERQWRREQGLASLFSPIRVHLRAPDVTFGNLESVLATGGRAKDKPINFRAHPNALYALADAGFDALSLANNHSRDYGNKALAETRRGLEAVGIQAVGAGLTSARDQPAAVIRRQGLTVALLAFSVFQPFPYGLKHETRSHAALSRQVQQAKALADLVVVSFHWGKEYAKQPTARQVALGHTAIDAGADLVVGHHPHRVQGVEVYRGRAIAYSLGNFLFDQPWEMTRTSAMLDWKFREDGQQHLSLYPLRIGRAPYAPTLLRGAEAHAAAKKLKALCHDLGTEARIRAGILEVLVNERPRVAKGTRG